MAARYLSESRKSIDSNLCWSECTREPVCTPDRGSRRRKQAAASREARGLAPKRRSSHGRDLAKVRYAALCHCHWHASRLLPKSTPFVCVHLTPSSFVVVRHLQSGQACVLPDDRGWTFKGVCSLLKPLRSFQVRVVIPGKHTAPPFPFRRSDAIANGSLCRINITLRDDPSSRNTYHSMLLIKPTLVLVSLTFRTVSLAYLPAS